MNAIGRVARLEGGAPRRARVRRRHVCAGVGGAGARRRRADHRVRRLRRRGCRRRRRVARRAARARAHGRDRGAARARARARAAAWANVRGTHCSSARQHCAVWSTKSTRRCALVPSSAVAHAAARRPVRVRLAHCGPGRAAADPPALRCTATASACARAICTAAAPSPPSSHSRALLHARHLRRACMPSCVRWEALGACGLDGTSRTTAARLWRRTR